MKRAAVSKGADSAKGEPYVPRKYESPILAVFGLCTAGIAFQISKYLFLCYLYGFSRVRDHGLHFTQMGHTWVVSNGDQMDRDARILFSFIFAVTWLVPTFIGFVLIRTLLPKRDRLSNSRDVDAAQDEYLERRTMGKLNRPLGRLNWKFAVIWLITLPVIAVAGHWIGGWAVMLLFFALVMVSIFVEGRFTFRRFLWTVLTTACPACGRWPMIYKGSANGLGFLICEKCRIEWDLGHRSSPGKDFELKPLFSNILENIEKQIQNNDPPETRQTLERLTKEGNTADEARQLLATAGVVELFHIYCDRKPLDAKRFAWNLSRLPLKPWDAQGKEIYKA